MRPAWATAIPGPRDPLPEPMERFLTYLRTQRGCPPTTVRTYRTALAKFAAYSARPAPALRVRDFFRRYQIELADVLPSPQSRGAALAALRTFLRWGYREEVFRQDFANLIVRPRFVLGDPHPIPTADVPRLLAALPRATLRDLRDRALVHFLLSTGCRVSEACGVDRRELAEGGFRVLGKGGKHRTVFLTGEAWRAVQDYLDARGHDGERALFVNVSRAWSSARRLTPDGARDILRDLHMRAETPEDAAALRLLTPPHALRHTAATMLLEATGGDTRLVQEVLGHATLETLRVYTQITDTRKRAAYQGLQAYLAAQVR